MNSAYTCTSLFAAILYESFSPGFQQLEMRDRRSCMMIRRLIFMAPILLSIVGYTDEPIKEEKVKRAKAPFHVLFSNDTTNTLTCVSPYHKKGEPFREKTLKATVDETAGIGIESAHVTAGAWMGAVVAKQSIFRRRTPQMVERSLRCSAGHECPQLPAKWRGCA